MIPNIAEHGGNGGHQACGGAHLLDQGLKRTFQNIFADGFTVLVALFVEALVIWIVFIAAVSLKLKADLGAITDLAWQREMLLEILIRIFCDKPTEAVRKGMPRCYIVQEDDLTVLRAGLMFCPRTRH